MKYLAILFMTTLNISCGKPQVKEMITPNNGKGMTATFTPYGARIVSLNVPDKQGKATNVVWGFENTDEYRECKTDPYYGAVIGRYGNRIGGAKFTLDGHTYKLDPNNNGNSLHGGKNGFHNQEWHIGTVTDTSVTFKRLSADGEAGYPGNLQVSVTYTLTEQNALKIEYNATTDQTTVLNLTNHAFFNLNGAGKSNILKHQVVIKADQYTPVDSLLIPTGKLDSVKGTPFDFNKGFAIGVRIDDHNLQLRYGKGYDHNYVLKSHGINTAVAQVTGDKSGIVMQIYTDQPSLQFYTGNFMAGKNTMAGGYLDKYRSAFCMETQHYPDSPNKPGFPTTELKPGQQYKSTTIYKFSAP